MARHHSAPITAPAHILRLRQLRRHAWLAILMLAPLHIAFESYGGGSASPAKAEGFSLILIKEYPQ